MWRIFAALLGIVIASLFRGGVILLVRGYRRLSGKPERRFDSDGAEIT